jgi:hypothetical protein
VIETPLLSQAPRSVDGTEKRQDSGTSQPHVSSRTCGTRECQGKDEAQGSDNSSSSERFVPPIEDGGNAGTNQLLPVYLRSGSHATSGQHLLDCRLVQNWWM